MTRFLFVGGLTWRKGPDILIDAWRRSFEGHDDVVLVIKDFGLDGVYVHGEREEIAAHAASGALPRIELIQDELSASEMRDLYRSTDVLVHPYRGEGFGMPILEAMACGVPVITTAGGPTDEFCPSDAGWRIASRRCAISRPDLERLHPASPTWVLEPDVDHLVRLLQEAQRDPEGRSARGRAGREAAERLSWDVVAHQYSERLTALANAPAKASTTTTAEYPFEEDVELRVLAIPAWNSKDLLPELLKEWSDLTDETTDACLYLVADPAVSGSPEDVEIRVLDAARRIGADLEQCADINILFEPMRAARDTQLQASVSAYVPLHPGCAGHVRLASAVGTPVLNVGGDQLRRLLADPARSSMKVSL